MLRPFLGGCCEGRRVLSAALIQCLGLRQTTTLCDSGMWCLGLWVAFEAPLSSDILSL